MRPLRGREMALIALLVAAVGGYWIWGPQSGGATIAAKGKDAKGKEGGIAGADIPIVEIDQSTKPPSMPESLRNLFNYTRSPEEIAAEKAEAERLGTLAEEARRRREEDERRRAEEQARIAEQNRLNPPPPAAPIPPPVSLKFIGYMGEPKDPKDRLVVFQDSGGGGDIYIARMGEVVADNFKVMDIDFEAVTLGFVDARFKDMKRTLRMGG
ncbi:MAG: hypothetical protein ACRD1Z_01610 [Vicinamibacteria bacterium]